ncbi:MAG: hypothetical protein WCH35_11700 [Comamonadaceae bacterium]
MNQLDALKEFTTVVAYTGDFKQVDAYAPFVSIAPGLTSCCWRLDL